MNTLVLRRRLMYVGAIVLLLIPLYFLGRPSVRNEKGDPTNEGGILARIRARDDLGQSDLGALDPASESARLATLGLRGVAATILWSKAEYYKKEKYFDRMAATVNQLKILQPHFVKVWDFQAHNLSYNVSVEFDNYKHRYDWVKKGVYYLLEGCRFNKSRTELPFQLGDFIGSKMGIADEKLQFRELFRNDASFHEEVNESSGIDMNQQSARGPDGKPDNWRSGSLWYDHAYAMVDKGCAPAKSPLMFYCKSPQWQLKHAEAIQAEGKADGAYLGEPARSAWKYAGEQLNLFGKRKIRTSFGTEIFLSEIEKSNQDYNTKLEEFKAFCGEHYDKAYENLEKNLSDLERAAIKKEAADLSLEELIASEKAKAVLKVNTENLARTLPSNMQLKGMELASQLKTISERRDHIDRYRAQVNYTYWESRCLAEQEDSALTARSKMYQANASLDKGKLDEAIEQYDLAWKSWEELFKKFPDMMIDDAADAVDKSIVQYLQHVDKQDGQLPEGFVLKDYMEFRQLHAEEMVDPAMMNLISSWSKRYPTRNFLEGALAKSVGYAEEVKKREKDKKNEPTLAPEQPGSDVIGPAATEIKQILPKTTEPKTEEPKTEEPKTEEPKDPKGP
jgi:hypothetical protein